MAENRTANLARFAAELEPTEIPADVEARIVDLFVDWAGSALSGKGHKAVEIINGFARTMGPAEGPCEILISGETTSPMFASLVNAASSHISEQDDVHNGSVFHPATVVFPAGLAVAQATQASGKAFLAACVAGYEVGIRVGEFLGRSHYEVFHTTGTAGTFAAAATAGKLLRLDAQQMLHAFGTAGTQSAGLWEFLRDAADSKQVHTAKASCEGLMAAYFAKDGLTGAQDILDGQQGLAAGMSTDSDPLKIDDRLGTRWGVLETSFKYHASCRHTHPAADALLKAVMDHDLKPDDIKQVTCYVHQGAIDVLGPVKQPATVHQAKFCMAATLGLIATHRKAGLKEFDAVLQDETALSFLDRITMELDAEIDGAYPAQWIGKVAVETSSGNLLQSRVDEPKGDPGNTLSRDELDQKARSLILFSDAKEPSQLDSLMSGLWGIAEVNQVGTIANKGLIA